MAFNIWLLVNYEYIIGRPDRVWSRIQAVNTDKWNELEMLADDLASIKGTWLQNG